MNHNICTKNIYNYTKMKRFKKNRNKNIRKYKLENWKIENKTIRK